MNTSLSVGRDTIETSSATVRLRSVAPVPRKPSRSQLVDLVDELGLLKAQISELQGREKAIKERLISSGADSYDGDAYHVAIVKSQRSSLDAEMVKAMLTSEQVEAATKVTDVVSVRVTSRK